MSSEGDAQDLEASADLATLLASYFGDRLTPTALDALVSDVAAALADRRRSALTGHSVEDAASPGTSRRRIPDSAKLGNEELTR